MHVVEMSHATVNMKHCLFCKGHSNSLLWANVNGSIRAGNVRTGLPYTTYSTTGDITGQKTGVSVLAVSICRGVRETGRDLLSGFRSWRILSI